MFPPWSYQTATYIPAFEYIATYQQALQEERFSCCNIDDFSGYILYSMP